MGMRRGWWRSLLRGVAAPLLLVAFWQALASFGAVNSQILPSPLAVLVRWWVYLAPLEAYRPGSGDWFAWVLSGELPNDALASLLRVFSGFAIGAGLALPLGLLMGASKQVFGLLNPLVQILRPIPPIAFIPLSILWFGLGNPPAIFLISIGAFFPMLMNTVTGVQTVDGIYIRAARNLGVRPWTMFTRIMLPAAMPYILTGARIGMGTAFIVVIVSEMIAVNSGLGFRILEAREYLWSDKIIAGMFSIGFLGLGIDVAMNRLSGVLLKWHRGLES